MQNIVSLLLMEVPEYIVPLKKQFELAANPVDAQWMVKYLREQFDFFGIKTPKRKEIIREHKRAFGLLPDSQKKAIVTWCWQQPQREYQYFTMEMLRSSAKKESAEIIELYENITTTKSWWDTVDFIASNLVGTYFKRFPKNIQPITTRWMDSGNIWLQRTCLLFQLKYKKDLDTTLLESFIAPLATSKEFFIRKAIGWILREYSKTDPDYVRGFVSRNNLTGLSEREAMKWINRKAI